MGVDGGRIVRERSVLADYVSDVGIENRLDPGVTLLVAAVQRLSLARTIAEVQEIVRETARRICDADGATFVLREQEFCHYVDEDAISPLWKGQRFPLDACISGWSMRHRRAVAIEDIYSDDRIPQDAYRPTFVRSLAMVPIRRLDPIGAIGNYWAHRRLASSRDLELLQALADSTAVAMENVRVWSELEARVADRTAKLEGALKLNERILGTLAHEIRNCLTGSVGLLELLLDRGEDRLPAQTRRQIELAHTAASDGVRIVNDQLLAASDRAGRLRVVPGAVDVEGLLDELVSTYAALHRNNRLRLTTKTAEPLPELRTDRHLLMQALRNLVSNALKYTTEGEVQISAELAGDHVAFTVSDSGAGIAADDLQRIVEEWEQGEAPADSTHHGAGLGLPFVRRIATLLGGELIMTSRLGAGTTATLTVLITPQITS